jgi:ABC-type oligopeptide transport system ATPase subunit
MRGGKLVEVAEADQILFRPAQQYTKDLLAAVPEISAS